MATTFTRTASALRYGLLLGLLSILFAGHSFASHAMGGDLTYTCIGPNAYQVTFTFFRDCEGISAPGSVVISYSSASCGVSSTVTLNQTGSAVDITPICPSQSSACGGSGQFGTERYVYSGTLTLPAGCGNDWVLSWSVCCRNYGITTLNSPGNQSMYIEATLDNTVSSPCNSSPTFNNIPTPIVCNNQPVLYNHGVTDPDGDSLVFSLTNCLQSAGGSVSYSGGFNGTNPLSTVSGVSINSVTGQISFTPNAVQIGVICVLVEEYRNGFKIGETVRDMQFNVIGCSNTPPVASGINGTTQYDSTICVGQNFCFNIIGSDVNGDNITMTWNNGISGGIFNVTGNNGTNPIGQFCWSPSSSDVGSHFFTVTVTDDACLVTGSNTYTYQIDVMVGATINAGPDVGICEGQSTGLTATGNPGGATFQWSPSTGLSCTNCASPTASPTLTTTYTVVGTFPDGCVISDDVTVTVFPDPNVSIFPGTADICPGGSIQLTANSATAVSYSWAPGGMNTAVVNVSPGSNTTYTVTVTDGNGCTNTATAQVNVAQPATNVCNVIYVSPTGSSSNPGTQASPTDLITGIGMASCNGTLIKCAIGNYTISNPITGILGGLTLEGGFDPGNGWEKSSQAGATTIFRNTANAEGAANQQRLVAMYLNGATNFRFQDITIQTAAGTNNGMSSYGVHLTSCSNYYFTRTQVIAGNGATGATGGTGSTGATGNTGIGGGPGDNDCNGCNGAGGRGGSGAGAGGGAFGNAVTGCGASGNAGGDSNNYRAGGGGGSGGAGGCGDNRGGLGGQGGGVNFGANTTTVGARGDSDGCGAGDDGGDGTTGLGGAAGGGGALGTVGGYSAGFFVPGGPGSTGGDGQGGRGGSGGGGGGGQAGTFCDDGAGSGGGGGGGGGQGGTGGTGGRGGGGSFAVYLFNNGANGIFDDSRLIVGGAGAGGGGGGGGSGGVGGTRGLGNTYTGGEVGAGGNGGFGGAGGQGGVGGSGRTGLTSQLRIDGGTSPAVQEINFNLPGQPTIFMENISCTNTDIDFRGPSSATWNFGPNSTPQAPTGTNVTTQWSTIGRKTVIRGADTYQDFANVLLEDTIRPTIGTTAPFVLGNYRICEGESINLFESFPGINYIYHWDLDGGALPNTYSGPQYGSLNNITFNTAGTYNIVLRFTSDCCGLSPPDTLVLVVDPQPNVAALGTGAVCANDSTPLNLTSSGASTYSWTPATGLNTTTGNNVLAFPPSTTTYTVTGLNALGTCADQASVTVTVNDLAITPSATMAGCNPPNGTASANVTLGSGNYSYTWSPGAISGNPLNNAVPGTYVVVVTDNTTGCIDSTAATVPPAPGTPVAQISNVTPVACNGDMNGTATVNVTNGSGVYAYTWQQLPSLTPMGGNGSTTSGLPAGQYVVTVFDLLVAGCVTTQVVTIPEPLVLDVDTLNVQGAFCPTNNGTITVNAGGGTGPYTYDWGFTTGNVVSGLSPGNYTVTVTDQNGCIDSIMVPINCVLPVEYAYLEAYPYNGDIRLDWETTEEVNNQRFDVMRSLDGDNFVKVGEVPAKAREGEGANYEFLDEDVVPGRRYYYRLQQWDYNGESAFSNVVHAIVPDMIVPTVTSIYPNPFESEVNVVITLPEAAKLRIELTDLVGHRIDGSFNYDLDAGEHTLPLNMGQLAQGIYLGRIMLDGVHANTVKFIKAK